VSRGKFIVLEGLDGSGKSTQADLLSKSLRALGRPVQITAEPTYGPIGSQLRLYLQQRVRFAPLVLPYLFAADRADHLYQPESGVLAMLSEGVDVICDRYVFSSLAYQSTDAPRAMVEHLNNDFPPPDLTIYIEVDPSEGLAAKRRQSRHVEAHDTLEKQQAVQREYEAAIGRHGEHHRVVRVKRGPSAEATALDIWSHVAPLLKPGA
jgi:dTMP kinase